MGSKEFEKYILSNRKEYIKLTKTQDRALGRLYLEFAGNAKREALAIIDKSNWSYSQKRQAVRELLKEAAKLTDDFKGVLDKALIESCNLGSDVNRIILKKYSQRLSGVGVDVNLQRVLYKVPNEAMKSIYSRIWEDGLKLSDRIWILDKRTKREIERIVLEEIASGRPASDRVLDARLNKLLNPSRRGVRTTLHGRNVSFDAARLLRSERATAFREADRMASLKNPGIIGVAWHTSGDACGICEDLASHDEGLGIGVYKPGNLPGSPHPQCYDKETEVYTDKGWKFFKDLNGEKILSINPEDNNIEWSEYKSKISYKVKEKLIHFYSKNFDLMVTPGHRMYTKISNNYTIKTAKDLIKYSKFTIPRTGSWIGEKSKFIDINGYKIKSELYCKLMGYYLSEGSTTKRENGRYQTVIAQYKDKSFRIILNDLRELTNRRKNTNNAHIYISDRKLCKYLYSFGWSYEKYIPDEIKKLSPKLIKIFLKAYCLGDGSTRIINKTNWKKGLISKEIVYSTSSKKMADDLGELILKIGRYPSYNFERNKGKIKTFKNGSYIIKTDCWRIRENRSKNAMFDRCHNHGLSFEEINYNGMIYDVELVKNHVLWVKRNGKTCWSGNCKCWTSDVAISSKQFTDNWLEWMDNKSSHPELGQWYENVYLKAA